MSQLNFCLNEKHNEERLKMATGSSKSHLNLWLMAGLATTALTGGVLLFGSTDASAACVEASGVYTCSGNLTAAEEFNNGPGVALDVNTAPGFSIDATGTAFLLDADGNNITFTDLNNSTINGSVNGIVAKTSNGGGINVTTTGTVTGQSRSGIDLDTVLDSSGLGVTLNAQGDVFGGLNGVAIEQSSSSGDVYITTLGTVTGDTGAGINAITSGDKLVILAKGDVAGGDAGMEIVHGGSGVLSITTEGSVVGGTYGIIANNADNGSIGSDLIINTKGDVTGGEDGLNLEQNSSGDLNITTAGIVTGTSGNGINAMAEGLATGLTLNASGDVTGGLNGIYAVHQGSGDLTITAAATATVTGGRYGINAQNNGDNLVVNANGNVSGAQVGINLTQNGTGDLLITTAGTVSGSDDMGINAINRGANLVIEAKGDVTGDSYGINAINEGSGDLRITASGTVSGTDGTGINAQNHGIDLNIAANGDVTGGSYGINAIHEGSGDLLITTAGIVTGTEGTGINAEAAASAVNLTVQANGAVLGAETGINANHQGSGALGITTMAAVTGTEGRGIYAETDQSATNLVINANGSVFGGETGIQAEHAGSGDLSITTAETVSGTISDGINAKTTSSSAGNLILNVKGDVTGGETGINAEHIGTGDLRITTEGSVDGGASGIQAVNEGADLIISTKGDIAADGYGIDATQQGTGDVSITTSGIVTASGGSGIRLLVSNTNPGKTNDIIVSENSIVEGKGFGIELFGDGSLITIANSGIVRNLSDLSSDVVITANTKVNILNSNQITGRILLQNDFDNSFENNGIWLTSGENNFGGGANEFSNAASGTLRLDDDTLLSNVGIFNNAGAIEFSASIGDPLVASNYKTLTIAGDYVGLGGSVFLNTYLGDQDSPTDQLIFDGGNASGATNLHINNTGGTGVLVGGDGIKVVDAINGATTDDGAFLLAGQMVTTSGEQAVVNGAYAYTLHHNGISNPQDGDWYLRSQLIADEPEVPLYQGGVPTYEAYPQALLGLNGVSTLQQRVGNRMWVGEGNRVIAQGADAIVPYASPEEAGVAAEGTGIWGRIEGAHNKINSRFSTSGTDYEQNVLKLQAGLDGVLNETETGRLIGGITVHYAHGKTKTKSVYGDGNIRTDGYGFGGTLTWYGENGFYLDGQGQATWYRSDLTSSLVQGALTDGNHGFGYAFSAEAGQRFTINQGLSLTPQAQLTYSNVKFDAFTDVFDARISLDRGESLQGRLGLAVDRENSWQNAAGMLNRTKIYGIANLYYEFLNGTRVDVSGTSFASEQERLWGGLGVGGSYNWNNDQYSLFGEVNVKTSLQHFGDSHSVGGNVGFRVKW